MDDDAQVIVLQKSDATPFGAVRLPLAQGRKVQQAGGQANYQSNPNGNSGNDDNVMDADFTEK